eukprot:comp23913_c0_seq1/m.42155 comp23913_c0_seq1/g.42155  ORF comp23913_c0_seq1/g.42155 comp23913_c0_seq1/m.42155 type:complete len:1159 (-) comp23913_c0_seq1:682-4158(-)
MGNTASQPKYTPISDTVRILDLQFRQQQQDGTWEGFTRRFPTKGGRLDPLAPEYTDMTQMEKGRHSVEFRMVVKKDVNLFHIMTFDKIKTKEFRFENYRAMAVPLGAFKARKEPYSLLFEVQLPEFRGEDARAYVLLSVDGQYRTSFQGPPLPPKLLEEIRKRGIAIYNIRLLYCDSAGNLLCKFTSLIRVSHNEHVVKSSAQVKFNKLLTLNAQEAQARQSIVHRTQYAKDPGDQDDPELMAELRAESEGSFESFNINGHFVEAHDGTMLAYSRYLSPKPRFSLVVCGSPVAAAPFVVLFIRKMVDDYGACAFFSHYRGTGHSGGKRGGYVSNETYLSDLRVLIRSVRWNHREGPLILLAFGYAVSLQQLYVAWPDREPVDAYAYFCPHFDAPSVGPASMWHGMINLAQAGTSFNKIDRPFGIWVPERAGPILRAAVTYGDKAAHEYPLSVRQVVRGVGTAGLFGRAWRQVGEFCLKIAETYTAPAPPTLKQRSPSPSVKSGSNTGMSLVESKGMPAGVQKLLEDLEASLNRLEGVPLGELKYREARDGTRLAYALHVPPDPKKTIANVIMLSGIAFHRGWAHTLAQQGNVRTYVVELRGSGFSGGKRGETPSREAMWWDITTIINCIKYDTDASNYPTIIMADGVNCGTVLNYLTWEGASMVDAVLLASPFLLPSDVYCGTAGEYGRLIIEKQGGSALYHMSTAEPKELQSQGVSLRVPEQMQEDMGWPETLSQAYLSAMIPSNPVKQLIKIALPMGVWAEEGSKFVSYHAVVDLLAKANEARKQAGKRELPLRTLDTKPPSWGPLIAESLAKFLQSLEPPPRPEPLPESKLEDFKTTKVLGTGMLGTVYLAEYKGKGSEDMPPALRYYALKKMRKAEVVRDEQVEHVLSEKRILQSLDHTFIARYIASFQDPTHLYFVLEYALGGEVFTQLKLWGRMTEPTCVYYAAEIILALDYLHQKDTIYRDLKLTNIMVDLNGHIKLVDFGFARILPRGERTTTFCGTVEYLAPEIVEDKPYDRMVDWWALGVCIFELLANHLPFRSRHPPSLAAMIVEDDVQFPDHFSNNARSFIGQLMAKDPTQRLGYVSTRQVAFSASAIKSHPWLSGVDWAAIANLRAAPPIKPKYQGFDDTSNFIDYKIDPEPADTTDYGDTFKDF